MLKDNILELFEKNRGVYLSGEQIADKFGVTRSAVWKAVKALENDGYAIRGITNKGYILDENNDILSVAGISKYLSEKAKKYNINIVYETGSTNSDMKELAQQGECEGSILISGKQTKGKGRMGRSFYSPKQTGIYMSLLLRPKITAEKATLITTSAAVAVCKAIEKLTGNDAQIKWVNDVFYNNKKVCGILTEASIDFESGGVEYIILGIGINAIMPKGGFPADIKNIAGSIFNKPKGDCRNMLTAEILNLLAEYYENINSNDFISDYKSRSIILGKTITYVKDNVEKTAEVLDIDDMCRLVVKTPEGNIEKLLSGEVTIGSKNII